eukprot:6878695-Prymnesium_polylepis.2
MNDHISELCMASLTSAHSPYLVSVAASAERTSAAVCEGSVLSTTGPCASPTARNGELGGSAVVLRSVTDEPRTSQRLVFRRPADEPDTPLSVVAMVPARPWVKLGKTTSANSDGSAHGCCGWFTVAVKVSIELSFLSTVAEIVTLRPPSARHCSEASAKDWSYE